MCKFWELRKKAEAEKKEMTDKPMPDTKIVTNNLLLKRFEYSDLSTIGELYLGFDFLCHTLEDTVRQVKIKGKTAIPPGRYQVSVMWSRKRKMFVPCLRDVLNYDYIQFHWGNTADDTDGCILSGNYDPKKPDWIGNSQKTCLEIVYPVIGDILYERDLYINIIGGPKLETVT